MDIHQQQICNRDHIMDCKYYFNTCSKYIVCSTIITGFQIVLKKILIKSKARHITSNLSNIMYHYLYCNCNCMHIYIEV